ncbi:hypothetical protein [Salinivibrio phage CW02]|uniref:Uncharacterized protein n=1 Tax=Salinivibrio phage CW02 TaxID=1161935 RepID=H9D1H9_9CAUD|nr:hypothetical protein F490_gp16 [Salinivibrio phage CW02]AFE86221.1 hypothetical protein [Salinivibrio phage CW02]
MPISFRNIKSGYDLYSINYNFTLLEQKFDEKLDRQSSSQGNEMRQDLDMNGHDILNIGEDSDILTKDNADARYVNVDGDSMEGSLSVQPPYLSTHAAQYGQVVSALDKIAAEKNQRQAADANLQAQITNSQPLEGSAFSPISWHKQVVENSINIPDDVNAWSFGPTMTIESGQSVTIGSNSFWTIADGEQQ